MATAISSCRPLGACVSTTSACGRPTCAPPASSKPSLLSGRERQRALLGALRPVRGSSCIRALPEDPAVEFVEKPEEGFTDVKEGPQQDSKTETVGEVLRKRRATTSSTLTPTKEAETGADGLVDRINPYIIGRKSRAVFDDAWNKLSRFGSASSFQDFYDDGEQELQAPQAAYTTVLVVGATGRVGRVLLRKLLLRGYTVKVLSRKEEAEFPKSAEVVIGDVGDYTSVREAVKNVDKVVYCAAARSTFTADVNRVDYMGVCNFVRALQDQYNLRAIAGGKSKSSRAKVVVADFKLEVSP